MTIPQALNLAVHHHNAGRLADAEALYRQILAVQPNHADALHHLGLIAHQVGRHDLAVEWIRKAIMLYPNNAFAHFNLGEAYRTIGRLDDAIAAYRRALQLRPDLAQVHNNLGNVLRERGQTHEAIAAYRRALQADPDFPEAHNNLGNALSHQNQIDEAIAAFRRALELKPDYPEAHNNLGVTLAAQGRREEATAAYRRALRVRPDYTEAYNNLGAALARLGQFDEAVTAFRRALELKPEYPEALNNLGAALAELGQFDEAITAFRRGLELKLDHPEIHVNLGNALRKRGQLDEAVAAFRCALHLKPDVPEVHTDLGAALTDQGQLDEAIVAFRRALELKPDYPAAYNNLGNALREQGELDEAVAAFRRAIELKPDLPEAHNNLGSALKDRGELDEAIAAFRCALHLNSELATAHSNLVYALHFHPGYNGRTISEEHEHWNCRFSDPLKQFILPHANDRSPERRLRVAYVSPDFLNHAVGRYLLPLFERHDRERFEILCYSGVAQPDCMTERFRALAGAWRSTVGVSDARLAEMIREDGVDITVDLSLHTARNRLPMFALQPAPVQVAWLAYAGSTGLHGIGYRLTDAYMEPLGEDSAWPAEEPVRLPDCWCCYDPVGNSPEVNALPALSSNGMTFGSLNNFAKVHEGVLARWARLLEAIKGSRLMMFCPKGRVRERVRAFFYARGIATERLELVGFLPRSEHLRLYQRIDLGLDPFPYNGMTTTCDALWMGVPVLTLPGEMPVSRAGLSLLSNVGLGKLVTYSEEDYVRMAVKLAGDLPCLADLRATMRPRMLASPLMDAPRFARNVEAAYRSMWQAWCNEQSPMRA